MIIDEQAEISYVGAAIIASADPSWYDGADRGVVVTVATGTGSRMVVNQYCDAACSSRRAPDISGWSTATADHARGRHQSGMPVETLRAIDDRQVEDWLCRLSPVVPHRRIGGLDRPRLSRTTTTQPMSRLRILTVYKHIYTMSMMSPKELTAFRLEPEIMDALRRVKDRDGVPLSFQVDRALRAWIKKKGVAVKSASKAGRPNNTQRSRRRR